MCADQTVLGKRRYKLLSEMNLEQKLSVHKDRLMFCGSKWLLMRRVHRETDTRDYIGLVQHCYARDCPVCLDSRIARVRKRLSPHFYNHNLPVRFVTLTFGDHQPLTRGVRDEYRKHAKNFMRRLNRKGHKFWGLWLYECKNKGDGMYHHHYHLAMFGRSPHHLDVTRVWKTVIGQHASTMTKYRQSKSSVLRYFAKRAASVGIGKDMSNYLAVIHGTRVWNSFGISNLEVAEITAPKAYQEYQYFLMCVMEIKPGDKPPPDLLRDHRLLDQMWGEMC